MFRNVIYKNSTFLGIEIKVLKMDWEQFVGNDFIFGIIWSNNKYYFDCLLFSVEKMEYVTIKGLNNGTLYYIPDDGHLYVRKDSKNG